MNQYYQDSNSKNSLHFLLEIFYKNHPKLSKGYIEDGTITVKEYDKIKEDVRKMEVLDAINNVRSECDRKEKI